jgi:hypothetical protein
MKTHALNLCLATCYLLTSHAHAITTDTPFHRLVIAGHIQALVKSQQDHQLVELMGPKDQLAHIDISNHDDTLSIKDLNHYTHENKPMVVAKIHAKQLNTITLSGATSCSIEQIKTHSLTLHASGNTQCSISGNVQHLTLHHSGSGHLYTDHLKTKQATLSVSGISRSYVQVNQQLTASASGASMIKYYGQPQLTCHHSGHAKITAIRTPDKNSYQGDKRLQKALLTAYHLAQQQDWS